MRFKIVGANKETGDDVSFEMMAVSHSEAEHAATAKGVLVESVTPIIEEVNLDSIPFDEEPAQPAAPAAVTAAPAGAPAPAPAVPAANGHAPAEHGAPSHEAHHDPAQHEPHHPNAHLEYKLLQNQALYLLEKTVNRFIIEGWEPIGGLTISIQNNAPNYFQAMIRWNKEQ